MLFRRFILLAILAASSAAHSEETTSYTVINQDLPTSALRIRLKLEASLAQDQNSGGSQTEIASIPIPPAFRKLAGENLTQYIDLGQAADGFHYHLLLGKEPNVKILSQSGSEPMYVVALRSNGATVLQDDNIEQQTEKIVEGLNTSSNQFDIPLKPTDLSIGTNGVKGVSGRLRVSLYSRNGSQIGGSVYSTWNGKLSGTQITSDARVLVTISPLQDPKPGRSQRFTLRFEPFDQALPARSVGGAFSDILDVTPARIAVEQIANDFSEIVLAVVYGSIEDILKYQTKSVTELPAIAQMELFDRRLMTGDDLLSASASSGGCILIFGDLVAQDNRNYYGGPSSGSVLPLTEEGVQSILRRAGQSKPPLCAFVVRQIDLRKLYGEHIGRRPDYLVLSDLSDPLQVQFRVSNQGPGGMYYPGPQGGQTKGSLRDALHLPEGKVSVVAVDSRGKIVYTKADAADNITEAVITASNLLR